MKTEQFVFLDDRPWPYMVRKESNGEWWLYYWSEGNKNFVTLRKADEEYVNRVRPFAMDQKQADLYLKHPGNKMAKAVKV